MRFSRNSDEHGKPRQRYFLCGGYPWRDDLRAECGSHRPVGRANAASSTSTLQEGNANPGGDEVVGRCRDLLESNKQLPIRNLAEATGGFLLGESNDLRTPLRHVNEEIASYYELTYDPHIDNYDGSFHKLKLDSDRKNLVLQARNGYFALPPEARARGPGSL